jgi:oligopeptide/dipeptide ABC transporter ATP-binding protein
MGVVARMADRVQVMKDGVYVEEGTAEAIFDAPQNAYTRMLLDAMPRLDQPDRPGHTPLAPVAAGADAEPLLSVADVKVQFPIRVSGGLRPQYKTLRAVDGISFDLKPGETLGVVGESGCGKSTLARAVLRLVPSTDGTVSWIGRDLLGLKKDDMRKTREDLQIVFQDPLASLICDEAVSALDVSIQAQIVELLIKLQQEMDLSMIFISHDLSVVREISHRVMVLYLGRVVEMADRDQIYEDARHPYTQALISAVPVPDPKVEKSKVRIKLDGELPSPMDTRAQLRFMKSKLIDDPDAEQYRPELVEVVPGHWVAEHDPVEA